MTLFHHLHGHASTQAAGRLAAGLSLAAASCLAHCGQAGANFVVQVEWQAPSAVRAPDRVFCSSTPGARAFGAVVTTVCSTGAVISLGPPASAGLGWRHGGAAQHLVDLGRGLPSLSWRTTPSMAGTVVGWQLLRHADMQYLELTLGW